MSRTPVSQQSNSSGGFALVLALSIMAFVLLLVLSISTLVQVESRTSLLSSARVEAEQAALLGLNIALGELQKAAGPDQRVTATVDILPITPDQTNEQPHLLGVWESFTQENSSTGTIDYDEQKTGDFIQWPSSASLANKTDIAHPLADAPFPECQCGSSWYGYCALHPILRAHH